MAINIFNPKIKNTILYLGWVLFFLSLFLKGCKSEKAVTTTTTVPAITNELPTNTEIKTETIQVPKWYKDRTAEKKLQKDITQMYDRIQDYQNEIDTMIKEYAEADSLKKAELYRLANQLKKFESHFEDENLSLTINGILGSSEIKEITPSYKIKPRTIQTPSNEVKFRFLVGGGVGINKELNQGTWKLNAGFQNQRGNIIRGSFQKIGNQDYYLAEYDFSLFKISK